MRIAIVYVGSSTDTKGLVNFVCEEARQLKKRESESFQSDVFMIRIQFSFFLSLLLRLVKGIKIQCPNDYLQDSFDKNGAHFNNIWVKRGLFTFFYLTRIIHRPFSNSELKIIHRRLADYDYVIAHTSGSHYAAYRLFMDKGISYGAFWHGTELNVDAFASKEATYLAKNIMESAHYNFFVSQALMETSFKLTGKARRKVIYTGPSDIFRLYPSSQKKELREIFGVPADAIVIGYAGNLIPLKNVMLLPPIFKRVKELTPEKKLIFWLIGNGELEVPLRKDLEATGVDFVMHGKVQPVDMPNYMNCLDVLLLISKAEGLGLVGLEALRCGAKAFGSMAGGIPEAIGKESCVELGDQFVEMMAQKLSTYIKNPVTPVYDEKFSWDSAIDGILECIYE